MEIGKLFRVLVVGGAAIVGSGCTTSDDADPDAAMADVSVDTPVASDATAPDAESEAALCFCNTTPECCDGAEVKAGFECCWSTSC